jgi:hypothetical protein
MIHYDYDYFQYKNYHYHFDYFVKSNSHFHHDYHTIDSHPPPPPPRDPHYDYHPYD